MKEKEAECWWIIDDKLYKVDSHEHHKFKENNEDLFVGDGSDNQYKVTLYDNCLYISVYSLTDNGLKQLQLTVMNQFTQKIDDVTVDIDSEFCEYYDGTLNEFLLLKNTKKF